MVEFENKQKRIGIHSHIQDINNLVNINAQDSCKKALIQIKSLLTFNKSNQIFIIKGAPGTGKTILAQEIFQNDFLINSISASEVNSLKINYSEFITQEMRRSIRLRIKEVLKVIEGEVTSLTSSKIGLKTLDMESIFEIGDKMQRQIEMEKIVVGDVIRIIKERGKIIKLGITSSKIDPDLLGDLNSVSCPEGELFKTIEEVQNLSLHDIDCLNNRTHGYLNLYNGETGEIFQEVRNEVNEKIKKWILEGKVVMERGILIIDNVHVLSDEILSLINKSAEMNISPMILLIDNSVDNRVINFINTALVIKIDEMGKEDFKNILISRISFLAVNLETEALDFLVSLAVSHGINYAINILDICVFKERDENALSFGLADFQKMSKLFLPFEKLF
ncbi:RuvB-like helicase (RVB2) [Vairimorpha necatrix]|uniref:RuvB-like helicase n=1 Tax=Vairimorpha necatrix TaxID=6039 RepID=A0AAX4J8T9_9MICR